MRRINLKGVSVQTWVRTIVLVLALVNQALVMFGITKTQIELEQWTQYASYIFTVVTAVWSWWKNNSFTDKAQEADIIINPQG
ncbi:MAG: phage holin [Clostridia bacterium]|nr:phage holin [Clostridia bacterium]